MAFGRTFEKLLVRITGDESDFTKSVRRADRAVDRITRSAGRLALGMGAVGAASAAAGAKIFQIGSDALETQSKFDTVFGESREHVQDFLDDFGVMAGLSKSTAQEITATTGAIVQGFGFAQEESAAFAEEIVRLSGDLGSFNNIPTAEVAQAIQSALAGEREAIKRLGIVLRQADVDERALLMTRKDSVSELTQQEKATATLALITEKAGVAVGDLARTQDSAANRAKQIRARFRNIVEDFSRRMIPALEQILPLLEELAEKSEGWAEALAEGTTTFLDLIGISDPVVRAHVQGLDSIGDSQAAMEMRARRAADEISRLQREIEAGTKVKTLPTGEEITVRSERVRELTEELEAEMAVLRILQERLARVGQETRETAREEAALAVRTAELRQQNEEWVAENAAVVEGIGLIRKEFVNLREELELTGETSESELSRIEESGVSTADRFSATLVDALDDGASAFKRFADFAIDQLLRIAAQRFVFSFLSTIFPGAGFVQGFGRSIGALPGRAHGGPVSPGRAFRVAEMGRGEIFVPDTRGRVETIDSSSPPPLVLDVGRLPRPADPRQAARDGDWLRFLSHSLEEYHASGGRLTGEG